MLSFIEINHINLYRHFMKSFKQPLYYAILKHLSGPLTTIYTPRNHYRLFLKKSYCNFYTNCLLSIVLKFKKLS